MKVLHVVGTRPNFMKVAPVMRALGNVSDLQQVLVHTGQHYDARMSDTFLEDLDLPRPNHFLGVGSGSHAEQTARVMVALEPALAAESPDLVLVPGDVNSTLAAALTAAKAEIPVAHLEAGLRSWDRSMPEEHNRVLTDHLAELLLTPTRVADENLVNEGIARNKIKFVGNTMIDSLRTHEAAARRLNVPAELEIEDYVLVTLHRPGLVDRPDRFEPVLETLEEIAASRAVVYPIHPRSRRRLKEAGWRPRRLRLLEPQSYGHLLRPGAGSRESSAEVGEHLAGLDRQVTGADEVAVCIFGFLAGDEHQSASGRDGDMGVRVGCGQILGIDELERH